MKYIGPRKRGGMGRWAGICVSVAILFVMICCAQAAAGARPLNLLFLMTDQQHAQCLGTAGHPIVKTPHLDRLAREGVRFSQAFAPVPYCSPTRAALVTGLYPSRLGLGRNINGTHEDPLRLREPTRIYQHALTAHGYHCYQLGKWHLGAPTEFSCFPNAADIAKKVVKEVNIRRLAAGPAAHDAGPRPGETELIHDVYLRREIAEAHAVWITQKGIPAQDVGIIGRSRIKPEFQYEYVLADSCIDLLRKHREEPFAITYSVSPPHAPWVAPAPYYDMYDPARLPLPGGWRTSPSAWTNTAAARMVGIYGEAGLREYLRCYYAQVTMMDDCIGRILQALDDLGLREHTLVVFTSDHGNLLGHRGMMDKTVGTFYDDLMRVPLLMRLPGIIPAGETREALVSLVDVAPTLLDYLNIPASMSFHGTSLRPIVDGTSRGRDAVFGERGEPTPHKASRMIRTREWKLCLLPKGVCELYDLKRDPEEIQNVADVPEHAAQIRQLAKCLYEHMRAVGDPAASFIEPAGADRQNMPSK